jgi:hypothetical protein
MSFMEAVDRRTSATLEEGARRTKLFARAPGDLNGWACS